MRRTTMDTSDRAFEIGVYAIAGFAFLVTIYPIYFVVIASFSDPVSVAMGRVWLFPREVTLEGYARIFEDSRIWIGYRNTIFYTSAGTLINLLVTLPAAYALSRRDLIVRGPVMFYFVFTMFFSGGLVPLYLTVQRLGMVDTIWAMLLVNSLHVFNLIIARTFFQNSIPDELRDAAMIDGCTNTKFFVLIVLPLSKAIIAVLGLYYAVFHWNSYLHALMFLRNRDLVPLQLVLRSILVQNQVFEQLTEGDSVAQNLAEVMKYALIIVSAGPMLVLYPFIQKYFAKGVMIGSLKG